MTPDDQHHCRQMMQSVIDAMPANIAIIDLAGAILLVNHAWRSFAAQNDAPHLREDSIGCNYLAICRQAIVAGAPRAEQTLEGIQSVLSGQQDSFCMDYPCHSPDHKRWFQMTVSRHDGPLQAVFICHQDITRLILTEQQTSFLSNVIEENDSSIVFKDLNCRVVMTNQAFAEASGHSSAADLIGKTDAEIFSVSPDTEPIRSYHEDDLAAQKLPRGQYLLREEPVMLPDGKTKLVLTKKYPLFDPQGELIGTGVIATDITLLKKTEATLHKLSRAVQQSPVSILITDHEGSVEFLNPQFTEMTGFTRDEVLGQNLRFLKSGKMLPELYQQLWETISAGKIWQGELLNRKKQGGSYWERATISPIRDHTGQISHYLAIKEDITEQKLLREQLLQSQKMETVGQLAGGLAHDFNNLLGIIGGYASLLQLQLEQQHELQQLAHHIQSAVEKAATLTHGLLAYSRQQVIQLQHHDLRQLICLSEEFLGRILGDAISLQFICADQPLVIHADSLQIEQVLYNLAANARDAMPHGGSFTIETSLVPDDDSFLTSSDFGEDDRYALLTITDTGCGMDRETIKRLFDPFFTTKQVGKGTGLGLSVAYGIIRQHNGYIQVQSKPRKGTVFRIYLPLRDCDDSLQGGRGTKGKNQTDNADTE